jgi:pyruvate dehydrogenase kinase 2/3/4
MQSRLNHLEATNQTLVKQIDTLQSTVNTLTQKSTTMKDVSFYAGCNPTKLNLSSILDFCTNPNYSTHVFCHRELPIRFAQQVLALDTMPHGLALMPSVMKVKQIHMDSFELLRSTPVPETPVQYEQFDQLLAKVDERHQGVIMDMAQGLIELKVHVVRHKIKVKEESERMIIARELLATEYPNVQTSLDEFFEAMIGVNFLMRQHLEVQHQRKDPDADKSIVGIVAHETNLESVVRSAINASRDICTQHFGDSPDVKVVLIGGSDKKFARAYIPSHIFYIVLELMKNSLRAVVEHCVRTNGSEAHTTSSGLVDCEKMPAVTVTIVDDPTKYDDVAILVQDRGGGFRRSVVPRVMSYMYTTAQSILTPSGQTVEPHSSPLAGYGYGLPVSRLYARHFGGDLEVTSMEGHGTDALLLIPAKTS